MTNSPTPTHTHTHTQHLHRPSPKAPRKLFCETSAHARAHTHTSGNEHARQPTSAGVSFASTVVSFPCIVCLFCLYHIRIRQCARTAANVWRRLVCTRPTVEAKETYYGGKERPTTERQKHVRQPRLHKPRVREISRLACQHACRSHHARSTPTLGCISSRRGRWRPPCRG